jgi:hypothetical protein
VVTVPTKEFDLVKLRWSALLVGCWMLAVTALAPAYAHEDDTLSFPFPLPTGSGGLSLPIPGQGGAISLPIPGGKGQISWPFPLPGGSGTGTSLPFPLPGGNSTGTSLPFPLPGGNSTGTSLPFPLPGGSGTGTSLPFPLPGPAEQEDPDGSLPAAPVANYQVLTVGGRPVRVAADYLPLRLYSSDPGGGRITAGAVQVWNEASARLGSGPMFQVVSRKSEADFSVDWTGRDVTRGAVGSTRLAMSADQVRVLGISIKPGPSHTRGDLAEILAHELGHTLGLDHSGHRADLMFSRTHGHGHASPYDVRLSERDYRMFVWLYSQSNAVPLVANRQGGVR